MKKNNKGFTLVELIVVIAILGVLMAVLVPQYIQYVEKSRIGTDESTIGEIAHVMELAAAGNEALNGQVVTVTVKGDKTATSWAVTSPTSGVVYTAMTAEIKDVITATELEFKSKAYKAVTLTISIDANGKTNWKGFNGSKAGDSYAVADYTTNHGTGTTAGTVVLKTT